MTTQTLTGRHVRLEPLELRHVAGLAAAAAVDPSLYQWSTVPQDEAGMRAYVATALAWQAAGTAVPFATVRLADGVVIGSTRFWNIEHWAWPEGHVRRRRPESAATLLDGVEIGYSWLTRDAVRTMANTEAKWLMLTHAFESWDALRVCFHTDARNVRSAAALERIGARYEGLLRSHRLAVDFIPRDSKRFGLVVAEWPETKVKLAAKLEPRSFNDAVDGGKI